VRDGCVTSKLTVAAAAAFAELIVKEADNNVKLIVLDRFDSLRAKHEHVLDAMVMDILKVLNSPDMEVKRRAIGIALEMVSSRNVEDVVLFLKKQLQNTMDQEFDKNLEYRQLLIQSIHSCAIKFSEVAANVVYVLMDFLGDSNNPSAVDVIAFVREVVEKFPELRSAITEKLISTFGEIKSGKVFRGALWIVGEYCTGPAGELHREPPLTGDIKRAMFEIRKVLGEIPILASEQVRDVCIVTNISAFWTKRKRPTRMPSTSKLSNPKQSRPLVFSPMEPTQRRPFSPRLRMQLAWRKSDPRANRLCARCFSVETSSPAASLLRH
jgi:vesicle coat complex subunit